MNFKIKIDESTLDQARSGAIWGDIWVEFEGGRAFPEERWNDLPVSFVVEFLRSCRDVAAESGARITRFYDGPYGVALQAKEDKIIVSTHGGDIHLQASVQSDSLLAEICRVARDLVAACDRGALGAQADVGELRGLLKGSPYQF